MKLKFKIVKDNQKSIREKCEWIPTPIEGKYIDFVNDMHDYLLLTQNEEVATKYHLREGIGLAAPQVGHNIRALVVYYVDYDRDGNEIIIDHRLINPKIISESVKLAYLKAGEGCLSVDTPHEGYVYRKYKIMVKAFDAKTKKDTIITAKGYEAIVLQHELDHLDGVLFYDHIDKNDPFKKLDNSVSY